MFTMLAFTCKQRLLNRNDETMAFCSPPTHASCGDEGRGDTTVQLRNTWTHYTHSVPWHVAPLRRGRGQTGLQEPSASGPDHRHAPFRLSSRTGKIGEPCASLDAAAG